MAVNLVQDRWWMRLSSKQSCFPQLPVVSDAMVECPPSFASPESWTREDVRCWLEDCVSEYGLDLDLPDRFPMNGKGLCMLRKDDFRQRAPDAGDVLYNTLHSFDGSPSTLPYERSSPDALALKWKANLESVRWFDPHICRSVDHRTPEDCKSEVDYEEAADNEPLNLKVTRSRQLSPAPSSPPLSFSRTSTVDLSMARPLPLPSSPTSDPDLKRPLPLPTFDYDPMRSHDRVSVPLSAGGVVQSQKSLYPPVGIHPTYLPLLMSLPYIDFKQNFPTPSSSPPPSLLSSSSLSSPSSLFPSTVSLPTPSSSPQHVTVLPRYHLPLSSTSFFSSSSSSLPPPVMPPVMPSHCTSSPASAAASCTSPSSPSAFICSSPSSATITDQRLDQRRTPTSASVSNEDTPTWPQLMQVSTTSQTPEASPKIHLNLSTSDRLLWKFLAELLNCKTAKCISWEDRQRLTFQIVDPDELAELWGVEKCKPGMTYEKLSRALRYYYKMNIIAKVPGKRLTYRFITSPQFIKKGKRGAKPGVPHKRRNSAAPLTKTVIDQDKKKTHHSHHHQQQQQQQLIQD